MNKLFLSSLFLIFFIISCGGPSICECQKNYVNMELSYGDWDEDLTTECFKKYDMLFLAADCNNNDSKHTDPIIEDVTDESADGYNEYCEGCD